MREVWVKGTMTYTKEDAIQITDSHAQLIDWLEGRIRTLIDTGIYDINFAEYNVNLDTFYIGWESSHGNHESVSIDWAELADETNKTFLEAQAERDRIAAEQAEQRGLVQAERQLEAAKRAYEDAIAKVESMKPLQVKED